MAPKARPVNQEKRWNLLAPQRMDPVTTHPGSKLHLCSSATLQTCSLFCQDASNEHSSLQRPSCSAVRTSQAQSVPGSLNRPKGFPATASSGIKATALLSQRLQQRLPKSLHDSSFPPRHSHISLTEHHAAAGGWIPTCNARRPLTARWNQSTGRSRWVNTGSPQTAVICSDFSRQGSFL